MPLAAKLVRSLRAADDSSDSSDFYNVTDRSSSASIIDTGGAGDILSSEDERDSNDDGASEGEAQAQMSKVSFGALAKAQDALSRHSSADRKRKRGQDAPKSQDDRLEALRERLREIKAEKLAVNAQSAKKAGTKEGRHTVQSAGRVRRDEDDENSESSGSDSETAPKTRSSKHAPAVQSSKRMVSRKRTVVDVKKPVFRDPRFDNMGGAKPDENTMDKRYSFLKDYRVSEIADLRNAIKKTKNEAEKQKLQKKLLSMESQQKTREAKEQQQEIMREHKKKERELVKQGKQPFFLKKSEQKKLALIDRFQNMKSKQRDRVIERRRKKVASKERRNMPEERRGA